MITQEQFDDVLDSARVNEADTLLDSGQTPESLGFEFENRVVCGVIRNASSYAEMAEVDYREFQEALAQYYGYTSYKALVAMVQAVEEGR